MSGYCPDCGNTQCLCKEVAADEARAQSSFAASTGSANWRDACATARKARLNQGLRTLASWAQSRAMGEHDDETTLTILERKTAELRAAVNKAGWDSVAESYSPNTKLDDSQSSS